MSENRWDLIVIGGGPAGYTAAERAGAHGLRVLLVEKAELGGTCLNHGCIPTKALLQSSKRYRIAHDSALFGVESEGVTFNLLQAMARKQQIIETLREGVAFQMMRRKVSVVNAEARFINRTTLQVGEEVISAANILIASGAESIRLDIPGADLPHVYDTSAMLSIAALPERLAIIGGSPIALGFAAIFAGLGSHVTLLNPAEHLLPEWEPEIIASLRESLGSIQFEMQAEVLSIHQDAVQIRQGDKQREIPADAVLIELGRRPRVHNLGLEHTDLDYDAQGIRVDAQMRTNLPRVYAAGDVTGISMWAHAAIRMSGIVANTILGKPDHLRRSALPLVIYTMPEAAMVGLTEAEAQRQAIPYTVARLPLSANGRFLTDYGTGKGLCKVIIHRETRQLLGAHMVGGSASEQIFGMAAMLEDEFRVRDIQELIFPHPTLSEAFKDILNELPIK